jgi:ABC-type Na+ efflux pump permease subunit
VTAEFFVLAFTAAANPKLLALDLLLIDSRRPRAMFASILAGGLSMAIAVGLVDVLAVHAHAVNKQKHVSAGVDLAIGLALLSGAALLLTGLVPPRRRRAQAAADPAEIVKDKHKGDGWAQRALSEPRLLLAFGIGALIGLPGAAYLTALHNLIAGHFSTATQVVAVLVFVVIEFLLIIVPWLFLELWPDRTASFLKRCQTWLTGHVRQLLVAICLALGAYLTISALVRLA